MLTAHCHCGAVQVEVPRRPRTITNCNCSICRRYGTLWAYYLRSEVQVSGGPTAEYIWGDKQLRFVRCAGCGCVTHWEPIGATVRSRCGVNSRNFDPVQLGDVRIRLLDGAATWKSSTDGVTWR